MTAKEIRVSLVDQLGNKEDALNLYNQIKRSLQERKLPLNSIWWLRVTRNDYQDPSYNEHPSRRVIHFEMNNEMVETILTNR